MSARSRAHPWWGPRAIPAWGPPSIELVFAYYYRGVLADIQRDLFDSRWAWLVGVGPKSRTDDPVLIPKEKP